MSNVAWLLHRLKAMSIPEIIWRISQRKIQRNEKKLFFPEPTAVTVKVFNKALENLDINEKRMHLNIGNSIYSLSTAISLLGGYDYEKYKMNWHAGFQTERSWPKEFSYSLKYKQRDDIGDARTNWELNRHFQFALLAKTYTASGEKKYLDELYELFDDWNKENPFLFGISWTSVMEVAIRTSNWCYAYCFLKETGGVREDFLDQLRIGIINMTDYVANHYSRYSSANNHLIVEAFAIAQSGILLDHKPWQDLGISILTHELVLQNYPDGVNKELSLHYQSFYMEAMGLMMRLLIKNDIDIPEVWSPLLSKMSGYMADCRGDYGEYIEFGDNDEGKILDLNGDDWNHYEYMLCIMSILLPFRYIDFIVKPNENLFWLFAEEELAKARIKPLYIQKESTCYREGGITLLRSGDKKVLIGFDHGELGFGNIAAHGHADALSFQVFVKGEPLFLDPGTYIYHTDINSRNEFRKTKNHNTVAVEDRDQSEMRGAFMWGKKAKCQLIEYQSIGCGTIVVAMHDGYRPEIHKRIFVYDGLDDIRISDNFYSYKEKEVNFILNPKATIIIDQNTKSVCIKINEKHVAHMVFEADTDFSLSVTKVLVSTRYGIKYEAPKLILKTTAKRPKTEIKLIK